MNYPDLAPPTIMDWKAYRPTLMHRCRYAFTPERVNVLVFLR